MTSTQSGAAWSGLLVVLLALGAGLVAGFPLGERIYRYQWADARFCNDCHVHDYANEAWERSAHGEVTTCHDCHRVPIRHYPRNLWVTITDPPQSPDDIHRPDIPIVVCEQCHSEKGAEAHLSGPMSHELQKAVVKIDDSPMHRLHLDAEERDPGAFRGSRPDAHEDDSAHEGDSAGAHDGGHGAEPQSAITCMDCHGAESNRAHHFQSTSEGCAECHSAHGDELGAGGIACRQCHGAGFLTP